MAAIDELMDQFKEKQATMRKQSRWSSLWVVIIILSLLGTILLLPILLLTEIIDNIVGWF